MHLKLKFDDPFRIMQFKIQEMAFRFKLCIQQNADGKSQEGKQLKFAPL